MIYKEWKVSSDYIVREIDYKVRLHAFVFVSDNNKTSWTVRPRSIRQMGFFKQVLQNIGQTFHEYAEMFRKMEASQ